MNLFVYELMNLNNSTLSVLKDWIIPLLSALFGGVCTYFFDSRKNLKSIKLRSLRNAEYLRMVLGFQKASIHGIKKRFDGIEENDFKQSLCYPIKTTINQETIEKLLAYKRFYLNNKVLMRLILKKRNFVRKKFMSYGLYLNNWQDLFLALKNPMWFKKNIIYLFQEEDKQLKYCMNGVSDTRLEKISENVIRIINDLIIRKVKKLKNEECIKSIISIILEKNHITNNSETISLLNISEISYHKCFMAIDGYNKFLEEKLTSDLKEAKRVPLQILTERNDRIKLIKDSLDEFSNKNTKAVEKFDVLCMKIFKNEYQRAIELSI